MRTDWDHLLLEVLVQLKGRKKKTEDWITIATKLHQLAGHYPSIDDLAAKLQVSTHVVRSIDSLLKLPAEVQQLVRERKILYDAAYRLNTLPTRERQIEVARAMAGLPSHTQRAIIQYAVGRGHSDLTAFVRRLTKPKTSGPRTHLVVVPISGEDMGLLKAYCSRNGMTVREAVSLAIKSTIQSTEMP
jgi:hypothetical protein